MAVPALIQVVDDAFEPHRAGLAIPIKIKLEDVFDDLGFLRFQLELLLFFFAKLFCNESPIAIGWRSTVPVASSRILQHRPRYVLGSLPAVVLIHHDDELASHISHRPRAQVLCHGEKANTMLLKHSSIELKLKRVSKEARVAMHKQHVSTRAARLDVCNHALELRPIVITCRRTGIDVVTDNL
ncbi:MAG: hypothetical protein P1U84_14215 [Parvibaculaceae bacterium]|nr:hypothetical protein [Parvibaculaceae bacterium]